MRDDLAKTIVEGGRCNCGVAHSGKPYRLVRDFDNAPRAEGMRRPYSDRKHFTDHLAPLEGILRKNAGRPWRKVYSEIVGSLRGGGTIMQHVREHLFNDLLIERPLWVGGKAHYPAHSRWGWRREPRLLSDVCYVDRHGILRYAPKIPRPRIPRDPPPLKDEHGNTIEQIDGVWFRTWLEERPPIEPGRPPQVVYCKRQIGKRELKRRGLTGSAAA